MEDRMSFSMHGRPQTGNGNGEQLGYSLLYCVGIRNNTNAWQTRI